jgi:hypothetical protein
MPGRENVTIMFWIRGAIRRLTTPSTRKISSVLVRYEQGDKAGGVLRASGEVESLSPPGPGATNMVTGIATASLILPHQFAHRTGRQQAIGSDAPGNRHHRLTLPITAQLSVTPPTASRHSRPYVARSDAQSAPGWSTSPKMRSRPREFDWDAPSRNSRLLPRPAARREGMGTSPG